MQTDSNKARKHPRIGVVVLNWNGRDDTLECLKSVFDIEYPNFETILVDNGSQDGSVAAIRSKYPELRIIETHANLGFAGGNNVGITDAIGRGAVCIFLLNNDAVVAPDILDVLVQAAENHPNAGAFSGKIYCYGDPKRIWCAGALWKDGEANFVYPGAGQLDDGISFEGVVETDYASGCAMFIHADLVREVGLLDPLFFLTFEETDWCYRLRRRGFGCLVIPQAKIWHKGSASFGSDDSPLYLYFYTRNRLLWAERHLGLWGCLRVWRRTTRDMFSWWPSPLSGTTSKRSYWSLLSWSRRLGRQWGNPGFRAVRMGVHDYLLRRFGDCPLVIRELNRAKG